MVEHELIVSLLASYASSEFLHGSRRRASIATALCFAANGLLWLPTAIPALALRFKVPLVALVYLAVLYADTASRLGGWKYIEALQDAIGRLIPLFPLFSLSMAFLFLEVGELCQRYGFPTLWLNDPIYFGVLYGPCAYLYVRVKAIAKVSALLPTRSM